MDVGYLIRMANQIGAFFEAEPDQAEAAVAVANHLKRFWDPRMRAALLQYATERDSEGLSEIVCRTLSLHRSVLEN